MNEISLIDIGYTDINGFSFDLLYIDIDKTSIMGSLFGLHIGRDHFDIDILFNNIEIY